MFLSPLTFFWDLAIILMFAGGLALIIMCTAYLRRSRPTWLAWRMSARLLRLLAIAMIVTVAYGSFVEPQRITVTRLHVKLPIERPLRIAVLSDFHVGPYKGQRFVERVVRKTNELRPDVVILVGDYVLTDDVTLQGLAPLSPLSALQPPLGTYAVLGNHDHGVHRTWFGMHAAADDAGVLSDYLESMGIRILRNEHVLLALGMQTAAIAGIDDLTAKQADLSAALKDIPQDTPLIIASHSPDVILNPLSARADLIVVGHTHGGQIRLPWIGSIASLPTRVGRTYDQGLFQIDDDTTLAITRGVGESGPRARLFAPPEILLLESEGAAQPEASPR